MKKITVLAAATAAILPLSIPTASSVAADDFYKNKQLVLTIASRPGGGFNA
jgi:hypothetical protein